MPTPDAAITDLLLALNEAGDTDDEIIDALYQRAYPHLHALAEHMMARESDGHTLQATVLVNEAFLSLVDQTRTDWKSRAHFVAVAARIMRRVLVDHARAKKRAKRGGGWHRVTLEDAIGDSGPSILDVLVLDDSLCRLEDFHARVARVVELRIFGGLKIAEVAAHLGVSVRTVEDDWSFARYWLARDLGEADASGS